MPYINLEYFFQLIYDFLQNPTAWLGNWHTWLWYIEVVAGFLCGLLILLIFYLSVRLATMHKEVIEDLFEVPFLPEEVKSSANKQWAEIKQRAESDNPAEWRVAILDADAMLDELVKNIGYQGQDLGERLKSVEPGDFLTIDDAWEAHKVRNRIAHDGVNYVLTKREIKRIMDLYEKVFQEFDLI